MTARKKNNANEAETEKELAEVDRLFRELENDKSLPTFGDHFMTCLILGTAERVNLKEMYPRTYLKLATWLERHNRRIAAWQKKHRK